MISEIRAYLLSRLLEFTLGRIVKETLKSSNNLESTFIWNLLEKKVKI